MTYAMHNIINKTKKNIYKTLNYYRHIRIFFIINLFLDRRVRERTLEKLWRKNSGTMESFIAALEVKYLLITILIFPCV